MKTKAYITVYKHIQQKIIHGSYAYGNKIPSKRQTALEEDVSVITVEHAYELLVDEGYIESKQRSGYFVTYREGDVFESDIHDEIKPVEENGRQDFPVTVFAKACRKVLTLMPAQLPNHSEGKGNSQLRNAIANYLLVDLLGRSRIYGVEFPGYEKIKCIYRAGGVKVDALQLGKNGIVSSELKRTPATILHVTPYHSFPSGSTTDASKRREYIRWAQERDAWIIEDDYESEFTHSIKTAETLYSLDPSIVIYMNTFTKTISSSIRIGYMILPRELLKNYEQTQSFRSCTVSEYMQLVVAELLNNGSFERNLNRIRRKRKSNEEN